MLNKLRQRFHPARHAYFSFYYSALAVLVLEWRIKHPTLALSTMAAELAATALAVIFLGFVATRVFIAMRMMRIADGAARKIGLSALLFLGQWALVHHLFRLLTT